MCISGSRNFAHAWVHNIIVAIVVVLLEIAGTAVAFSQSVKPQEQPPAAPNAAPETSKPNPPLKQLLLTEKQVLAMLSCAKDVPPYTDVTIEGYASTDAETRAGMDRIAVKHGFASFQEVAEIKFSLEIVGAGYDRLTQRYIGVIPLIKLRIARLKADRRKSAEQKKEELVDLEEWLEVEQRTSLTPALKYPENVELYKKYRARLAKIPTPD